MRKVILIIVLLAMFGTSGCRYWQAMYALNASMMAMSLVQRQQMINAYRSSLHKPKKVIVEIHDYRLNKGD